MLVFCKNLRAFAAINVVTTCPLSIAICGYGNAALASALLLRAQDHRINILERGPSAGGYFGVHRGIDVDQ